MVKSYSQFESLFKSTAHQISKKFITLYGKPGWDLDKTLELIEDLKDIKDYTFSDLDQALDQIIAYDIPPEIPSKKTSVIKVFQNNSPSSWYSEFHSLGVGITFTSPKELSLDEIISKVISMNTENAQILEYAQNDLKKDAIKAKELKNSEFIEKEINTWDEKLVKKWATKVKKEAKWDNKKLIIEAVRVAGQANFILNGYYPRNTQNIAVLITLIVGNASGLLMQVSTGEGKSLIVSMLAVIKCLQGHTVDIVTSSPLLAKRDAQSMKKFYELFALT
jgi:hypothetical protein